MLGKLIKYESRACARIFVPMWAVSVGTSLLMLVVGSIIKAFTPGAGETVDAIIDIISVFLVIGLVLLGIVTVVVRFYQNLISDEGYLSFTLPVTATQHIVAKLLTGLLFLAGTALAVFLSQLITNFDRTIGALNSLFSQLERVQDSWMFFSLVLLFLLVAVVDTICKLYASMVAGSQFDRHRIVGSVVSYYLAGVMESIVMLVIGLPIFLPWINDLIQVNSQLTEGVVRPFAFLMLGVLTLFMALFSAAYFFVSRWLLTKRLNLQ